MSVGAARAATSRGPSRIGPYLILDVIGQGGTGIVFRAQHGSSGELVALKQVLAASVPDIGSVRREIDALRRLHHPGVVRIVAQGVDAGIPWYAMELLEGETLASYARRLWHGRASQTPETRTAPTEQGARGESMIAGVVDDAEPPPSHPGSERPRAACGTLPFVLQITGRLCETLGFMHGEGIVHRDLKSANVLLCKSGMPKLLDFGLAWRFAGSAGREVLDDVSSSIAGTAGYMSPEQIRGEMVDARADLYSLGCVLYELLTGRLPFIGRTAAEIRRYHLDAPVIPPSVLTLGVPPVLDDLVLRLLEKRAEDRPGHASEVARILSSVAGAGAFWDPKLPARSYVYRSAIVGRTEPLEALGSHVSRAFRMQGSLVLISGESGVGKTYLAMAAAREAANRGMRVVTSTCVPLGAAGVKPADASLSPFRNLLLAIADRCVASPELTPELLGARAKVLAACEPHLASLPSIAEYPEPEPLPARAAQERLLLALEESIAAFAAVSPCVCIIDDLQWSDDLSLSFLSSLPSQWFSGKGLVMIGVYRSDEETDAIQALLRRPDVEKLALGRLAEPSLGDMVRGMLALGSAPADFVDTFVRQSGGNPFFAAEYLRTAVGERLLYRGPTGHWQVDPRLLTEPAGGRALALPTSIAALIGRRLDGLRAPAQQMLAAAAVLGRETELDLLWSLAELAEESAWEPTRELITRQILEEVEGSRAEGRTRVRFLHDKLREAAYGRIPVPQRRALHRRAAEELERRLHGTPELVRAHATLAYHHKQGERLAKAIEHLELAGEQALETYANRDAIRHFGRAVDLDERATGAGAPSTRLTQLRRARWHRKLAEAHYALGDLEAVERHIVRGLHYAGYPPPRTKLGWNVSLVLELMRQLVHRTGTGERWYRKAPADQEVLVEAALGTHHLAESRYYSFEPLPMLAASLRAVNLGERAGVAVRIATPYAMLGMAAGISQLPALGRRYFDLAESAAIRTSDDAGMAYSLYAKAAWRIGDGAWDEVIALCTECSTIARRTRNVKALGMAQTLIGHAAFYTGRLRESVSVYRELEETARATGDQQHLSWGLYAGARARICLGDLPEARAMLLESSALLEPLVEVPSKIIAPGLLASLYLRSGDLGSALAAADCASARLRKNLPTVFATVAGYAGAAEVYLARWEELLRRGEHDERELRAARKAARRALFALLTFAISIPLGWPYYHRIKGESQRIAGRRGAAKSAFERARTSARKLGMPYDEALAHLDLARLSKPRSSERAHHLSRAEQMLERLECRCDLERASKLRAGALE